MGFKIYEHLEKIGIDREIIIELTNLSDSLERVIFKTGNNVASVWYNPTNINPPFGYGSKKHKPNTNEPKHCYSDEVLKIVDRIDSILRNIKINERSSLADFLDDWDGVLSADEGLVLHMNLYAKIRVNFLGLQVFLLSANQLSLREWAKLQNLW